MTATWAVRRGTATCALALAVALAPAAASAQAGSFTGILGARFGGAQRQSAYVGLELLTHDTREEKTGITLELEGGRRAGQVGLGMSSFGQITPIYRAQGVVMRTWKQASDLEPGQTYVGGELQITMVLGASYGWYWRVNGSAPGQRRYHALRFVVGI